MASGRYTPGLQSALRLLKSAPVSIRRVLIDERIDNERLEEIRRLATESGICIEAVSRRRLNGLAGGSSHQGVVVEGGGSGSWDEAALRSFVEQALSEGRELLLLYLDEVQDPHNLGACMRTAEAAGVDAVIAPQKRAAGLTPVARKTASGAAELVPFARVADPARTLDWMKSYGIRLVATAQAADKSLYEADLSGSILLIAGGERSGVRRPILARCDQIVAIPMLGRVESLNISVATGVCLFEIRRRRLAPAVALR